jgi:hypothetical protein
MKHTIIVILGILAIALPAKADEKPSRADMLKGLLVVGIYSRICPTPLSESAKAQTLAILKMFGELDSDWLERSIKAHMLGFKPDDIEPWCRDTAAALDNAGFGPPATGPQS